MLNTIWPPNQKSGGLSHWHPNNPLGTPQGERVLTHSRVFSGWKCWVTWNQGSNTNCTSTLFIRDQILNCTSTLFNPGPSVVPLYLSIKSLTGPWLFVTQLHCIALLDANLLLTNCYYVRSWKREMVSVVPKTSWVNPPATQAPL